MLIAIMSDSHDHWSNMAKAIDLANQKQCEVLLHAGDLIAPPGIALLAKFHGQTKFVWGNNEAERMGITRQMDAIESMELCGDNFEGEIDGVKIFMNHYPRIGELAAASGEFDLVIHGHTHVYRNEMMAKTLLLNPGEIQGYKTGKATFMIIETSDLTVTRIDL